MIVHRHPVIVVGSGIAGLSTALTLNRCTLVTPSLGGSGSTRWARGGIAAALSPDDSPQLHAADTVGVGGGLVEELVAELVTEAAPERVRWLIGQGTRFDYVNGRLDLHLEAGHSRPRIVHADGDATGAEVSRALSAAAQASRRIEMMDDRRVVALVKAAWDRVCGIVTADPSGDAEVHVAKAVILATGGAGRLYRVTTNPQGLNGDGLAMALRAGARACDLEFMQFHPTALAVPEDPLPLLTEALRGAGAWLVDDAGRRFMVDLHPAAELAPRDEVARAIYQITASGGRVWMDAGTVAPGRFAERFPSVWAACRRHGIDPEHELLPVTPAAHYFMGGIETDLSGRSSLAGLLVVGEAASTGLHGANRLASNSLLEGMVLGMRAAAYVDDELAAEVPNRILVPEDLDSVAEGDPPVWLRDVMWEHAGVTRSRSGLLAAYARLGAAGDPALTMVAELIVGAALRRTESRGSHYRIDFPHTNVRQQSRLSVEWLGERSYADMEVPWRIVA